MPAKIAMERTGHGISVEIHCRTHRGSYTRDGNLLTVSYDGHKKSAELGGHRAYPEQLARMLLSEMARGLPD